MDLRVRSGGGQQKEPCAEFVQTMSGASSLPLLHFERLDGPQNRTVSFLRSLPATKRYNLQLDFSRTGGGTYGVNMDWTNSQYSVENAAIVQSSQIPEDHLTSSSFRLALSSILGKILQFENYHTPPAHYVVISRACFLVGRLVGGTYGDHTHK